METLNFDLLLRILIAHFLADFIFQPTLWVKKKNDHGIKIPIFLASHWYSPDYTISFALELETCG